jgi:hypothetical protein
MKKHAKTPTRNPKWSTRVTEHSNAMDVEAHLFIKSPTAIARSLKLAAEKSRRRVSPPFRSAMSMLTFYSNRAGKNLTPAEHKKLDKAKDKLRALFGKTRPVQKTFKH